MAGLLSPINICGQKVRNRIVMPPMNINHATTEGYVTQKMIDHYVERAKARVGIIIVECAYVEPRGKLSTHQLGIHTDSHIPGLKSLAQAIKAYGAMAVIQIHHAGRQTSSNICSSQPVAPSAISSPAEKEIPRELTLPEIAALVEAFGEAARRAKKANFDGVEIHGAHGFLVNQFVSPYSNKRTDQYGGNRENRLRFSKEIIARIKERTNNDYPIFYRMSADEFVEGGLTLEESKLITRDLVEAGVNVMDISAGVAASRPVKHYPGYLVPLAHSIKQVVNVPVITVGEISEFKLADQIIREGRADLVAVGRAMLKDPLWAQKAHHALASSMS